MLKSEMDLSTKLKTRAYLYKISFSILLLNSINIIENKINLLGFKVELSQDRVTVLLKILLLVALLRYFILNLDKLFKFIIKKKYKEIELKQSEDSERTAGILGWDDDSNFYEYDEDAEYRWRTSQRNKKKRDISKSHANNYKLIVRHSGNIFLFIVIVSAIFFHSSLKNVIDFINEINFIK